MENIIKTAKSMLLLSALATTLISCSSSHSSNYGEKTSPGITANNFVSALNDVDHAGYYDENELVKNTYETLRSGEWFVIWDQQNSEYVAVDLNYIQHLEYYDYYYNQYGETAAEFRDVQSDDEYWNGLMGDGYGDDYEIVSHVGDSFFGTPIFEGIDSGYLYEDEESSFDVSLMAGEKEQKEFFTKAAKVSFTYNIDIKTSLALVTLGQKVSSMLVKTNGELTAADQAALMGDLQNLTGATLQDVSDAAQDSAKKDELVNTIAEKIGTSADNLENRLLPELFGMNI